MGNTIHSRQRSINVSRASIRGAGLIEVLVAVLIMAIGLLGIAAMQATALRNSQSSLERSQAVVQSYSIIDAMRANRVVALAGGYNMGMTCAPPGGGGSLVANDQAIWIRDLQDTMGSTACGEVVCNAGNCTVTVQWDDSRAGPQGATGDTEQAVETQTRI
ncbi:type IV pilus modification protein PilV [Lysobacter sp. A3-1-A15]|uniref:type IV pilus modification protein PilV n=1 Tax=Novilysobacter viscosus TaxID=3098602 RepID=UPI002ED8C2D4